MSDRIGPNCECGEGYYDNGEDSECQKCEYPCLHCKSKTECSSCIDTENRL